MMKQIHFWENSWTGNPDGNRSPLYRIPIPNKPGQLILDVGCGDFSGLENTVCDEVAGYVGIDISSAALKLVDSKKRERGIYNPVLATANALPFRDNSFDECITNNALSFMGEYLPGAIKEMARVSKGNIVFGVFHKEAFNYLKGEQILEEMEWCTVHHRGGLKTAAFTEDQLRKTIGRFELRIIDLDVLSYHDYSHAAYYQRGDPQGEKPYIMFVRATKNQP